jgi:hypothetical protein
VRPLGARSFVSGCGPAATMAAPVRHAPSGPSHAVACPAAGKRSPAGRLGPAWRTPLAPANRSAESAPCPPVSVRRAAGVARLAWPRAGRRDRWGTPACPARPRWGRPAHVRSGRCARGRRHAGRGPAWRRRAPSAVLERERDRELWPGPARARNKCAAAAARASWLKLAGRAQRGRAEGASGRRRTGPWLLRALGPRTRSAARGAQRAHANWRRPLARQLRPAGWQTHTAGCALAAPSAPPRPGLASEGASCGRRRLGGAGGRRQKPPQRASATETCRRAGAAPNWRKTARQRARCVCEPSPHRNARRHTVAEGPRRAPPPPLTINPLVVVKSAWQRRRTTAATPLLFDSAGQQRRRCHDGGDDDGELGWLHVRLCLKSYHNFFRTKPTHTTDAEQRAAQQRRRRRQQQRERI